MLLFLIKNIIKKKVYLGEIPQERLLHNVMRCKVKVGTGKNLGLDDIKEFFLNYL